MEMSKEIDTTNRHVVGIQGDYIGMLIPPRGLMTTDEALTLAAWLVTLADYRGERFKEILNAVQNS